MSAIQEVARKSSLTSAQVDSLIIHQRVRAGEMKLKQAAETRRPPVTVGAYYRTVKQAKQNFKSSILTLIVGVWLGYVSLPDLRRLLELVARGVETLSEDQVAQLASVIEALTDKIVT